MTVYSSALRGDIETRDKMPAHKNVPQAVSTTLVAGSLVYQDGVNGVKVALVAGTVEGSRIFFCKEGQTSTATLGEKLCTLYKTGHIVVGKCGGAIVVDDVCIQGETVGNEGEFEAGSFTAVADIAKHVAIYLGHPGEGIETGNIPTDAVDGDLGRFLMK